MAAITFGTAQSASVVNGTTITITNVACTGYDYLEVGIAVQPRTVTVSSVVFDTTDNLSAITSKQAVGGSNENVLAVWAKTGIKQATGSVVITLSTLAAGCATAQPMANVDQATPRDAAISATANAQNSVVLTGTVTHGGGDDIIRAWVSARQTTGRTWTADAGVTGMTSTTSGSGASHTFAIQVRDVDGGTDKVLGSFNNVVDYAAIGYNLNAAAASGMGSLVRGLSRASIVGPTALVA